MDLDKSHASDVKSCEIVYSLDDGDDYSNSLKETLKDSTETVVLRAEDGTVRTIRKYYITISEVLLSALGFDMKSEEILVSVTGNQLIIITEYMEYCKGTDIAILKAPLEKPLKDSVSEYLMLFLKTNHQYMCGLINAANKLDIQGLFHLVAAYIASALQETTGKKRRKETRFNNCFRCFRGRCDDDYQKYVRGCS